MRDAEKKTTNERLLLNSTTADVWAKEFVRVHGGDEGLMLTWFANAIEVGRTAGKKSGLDALEEVRIEVDGRTFGKLSVCDPPIKVTLTP